MERRLGPERGRVRSITGLLCRYMHSLGVKLDEVQISSDVVLSTFVVELQNKTHSVAKIMLKTCKLLANL